jgi:hypothetical protein
MSAKSALAQAWAVADPPALTPGIGHKVTPRAIIEYAESKRDTEAISC